MVPEFHPSSHFVYSSLCSSLAPVWLKATAEKVPQEQSWDVRTSGVTSLNMFLCSVYSLCIF